MILKDIYLQLDRAIIDIETCYEFQKISRHVCNYVERTLFKKQKFVTDGFNRLVINITENKERETHINSVKVLSHIFYKENLSSLEDKEVYSSDFIIDLLQEGLDTVSHKYNIPKEEILNTLKEFKENGFVNEWIHKKKRDKVSKVNFILRCVLGIKKFELYLEGEKDKQQVFSKLILSTDPDEVAFDYRFKDILINEDMITITSKTSEPLLTTNIRQLLIS